VSPTIEVADHLGLPLDEQAVVDLVAGILRREGSTAGVTVAFVSVAEMAALNERFRGLEGPTDVLSFPSGDEDDARWPAGEGWPADQDPAEEEDELGDVVVCAEYAAGNATAEGITLAEELRRLVVHGVLHLLGHDHEVDQGEMMARQEELLAELDQRPLLLESS
jgi:probable rRNA maturation factor